MVCCGKSDNGKQNGVLSRACVLCKAWKLITGKNRSSDGDPCVTIPGYIARKPDPCIYSQFLLMQTKQPVTWDNPDVKIFLDGVEQYTYNLKIDTEYDVEVTVHNASRDKPAVGTSVEIEWVEFGAGRRTRHPITIETVDVPIWPGTAIAKTKWRTPATPGHYCLEVDLIHPNDGNPTNNRGWNNTQVHAANSPVDRSIRIFNNHPGDCPVVAEGGGPYFDYGRAIYGWGIVAAIASIIYTAGAHQEETNSLIVYGNNMLIAYVVGLILGVAYYWYKNNQHKKKKTDTPTNPDRIDCHLVEIEVDSYVFQDDKGKTFDPNIAFEGKGPVWPAFVDPPSFVFLPGEAFRDVNFHTDAPDDPGPPGHFNINIWQGGEPSGGVSLTIITGGQ